MYWSFTSLTVAGQLTPNDRQRKGMESIFAHLELLHSRASSNHTDSLLSSSPSSYSSSSSSSSDPSSCEECTCEEFDCISDVIQHTAYCYYRGIIPVYGTKRDALLRYLYHVYMESENSPTPLADQKVNVYFVDDQDRYLRDVESYLSSLFLAAMRSYCPRFHAFVLQNVSVKTFLMPQFVPTLNPSLA